LIKFRNGLLALLVAIAGVGMVSAPMDVEAKRLGGGRPAGMQRQMPAKQPDSSSLNRPAQPNNAAAPAPAAPPAAVPGKRSWMGPLAGLAAGLGIAALMSHFGMGEALGNFMTMALVAMAAVFLIGWLMRRFGTGKAAAQGPQLAGAGAPYGSTSGTAYGTTSPSPASAAPFERAAVPQPGSFAATGGAEGASSFAATTPSAVSLSALPAGFDVAGFERVAKMIFIRLQAANDAANLDDLRKFTTPELFASLRLDLQDRGQTPNVTDVAKLDAEIADTARDSGQLIVSVRFHGLISEERNAPAQPFNELWHLVRPLDESHDWAIAGITPLDA
jgi:predicted lipid-binding transport protein (Tim44 family)